MKKMIEFGDFKTGSFTPLSSIDQYDLSNLENYFATISHDKEYTLERYSILLFEYMLVFFEKIKMPEKRKTHFRYIFERGIKTVTSVFVGLMEYTKNVDLAFHHGKKAFYFYIEFIEQISDAQNSFLQLTSRDAVMFVYKRTLFEVNKEMVKPVAINNAVNDNKLLTIFSNICKIGSSYVIQNVDIPSQSTKINEFVMSLNSIVADVRKMNLNRMELVLKKICNISERPMLIEEFLSHFTEIVDKS